MVKVARIVAVMPAVATKSKPKPKSKTRTSPASERTPSPDRLATVLRTTGVEGGGRARLLNRADEALVDGAPASEQGPQRFTGNAYNGNRVHTWYRGGRVVDIETYRVPAGNQSLFLEHTWDDGIDGTNIGFTESIKAVTDERGQMSLAATGSLLSCSKTAARIADEMSEGFPWQLSISYDEDEQTVIEEIGAGAEVVVNGRVFHGPLEVVRNGLHRELSYVRLGADPETSVAAMSRAAAATSQSTDPHQQTKGAAMNLADATIEDLKAERPDLVEALMDEQETDEDEQSTDDGGGDETEDTGDQSESTGTTPADETDGASSQSKPAAQAAATFDELDSIDGMTNELLVECQRMGLTKPQAVRFLARESKLDRQNQLTRDGAGTKPVGGAAASTQSSNTNTTGFKNALGKDPERDFTQSKELREYWEPNGGRVAFMQYAALNPSDYLDRPF